MQRSKTVKFVQFGTLTEDEILALSVCEITKPAPRGGATKSKDRVGTPYDDRLGPLENGFRCGTCREKNKVCVGHYGHIELPIPVYNKLFIDYIYKILMCVCEKCASPRLPKSHAEMQNLIRLKGKKRLTAFAKRCKKIVICPNCSEPLSTFKKDQNKEGIYYHSKHKETGSPILIPFDAGNARNVFLRISNETMELLGFNHHLADGEDYVNPEHIMGEKKTHVHQIRPESFILTILIVLPSVSRPYVVRDGERGDDDLTDKYNSIIKLCNKIRANRTHGGEEISRGRKKKKLNAAQLEKAHADLKNHIWTLMDNKDEKSRLSSGGRAHKCLRQRLRGKEGRIQTNVGGKRVDFSARSVIVPAGVTLKDDELGVPKCIADELTRREKVKEWNYKYLQSLVDTGQVNRVIRDGQIKRLDILFEQTGKCHFPLRINDDVERKTRDGDAVLFNRQPTLREESMLKLKAKRISGYAFRLSLWLTPGFNADFDGDEMNLHVPQSVNAIAEADVLMRASAHIVTGQRNGPVNGIVQDGLIGAYLLTNIWVDSDEPHTMITKTTFFNTIHNTGIEHIRTVDLLSRAQPYYPDYLTLEEDGSVTVSDWIPGKILISILFPTNFCKKWKTGTNESYPIVDIEDGVIMPTSGPLCKKVIGSKTSSAVQVLWKDSPEIALKFLSEAQLLNDHWLTTHGFSVGISDCMTTSKEDIAKVIVEMQAKVHAILSRIPPGGKIDDRTEREINAILNSAMNIGAKLAKTSMYKGERNAFNIMRLSGAKGSLVNLIQIVAFLGQQNINGKRIPTTLSGGTRTSTHFKPHDNSPDARGFVSRNYIQGLTPHESFFHAAGGRKGVAATAVKTSETGYMQKRVSRKTENFSVQTDGTVRNSNGRIIQFQYGDDGMDPKKLCRVRNIDYPFPVDPNIIADRMNSDARREMQVEEGEEPRHLTEEEIDTLLPYIRSGTGQAQSEITILTTKNTHEALRGCLEKIKIYECKIADYFYEIQIAYESSKAQYGDMVGLSAASSIGEPTTQLVLNTHQSAGYKGKDVSLGVPRFKEMLNATKANNQKKPSCTAYLSIPSLKENSKKVRALKEEISSLEEIESEASEQKRMELELQIKTLKEEALVTLQSTKREFEEITVDTFFVSYELQYLPEDVDADKRISPIGILTYEEYEPKWWSVLRNEFEEEKKIPESWVILIQLDVEEMFRRNVTIEEIADAIEENSEDKYLCVPSPNNIGMLEIYLNFSDIKPYVCESIELPPGETTTRESLLTLDNINFFICREVAIKYIRSIHISGIKGITKVFPREDIQTCEWILDIDCRGIQTGLSNQRFLDLLVSKGVDPYRTITDDMHAMYDVLGIEAARRFIIEEMTRVISFDGTYINPRHIQLLVDGMTHTGEITAVQRGGISRDVGPIGKLMFEQAVENAVESAAIGEVDRMTSVSAAIMYGLTAKAGTGLVEVQRTDTLPSKPVSLEEKKAEGELIIDTIVSRNKKKRGEKMKGKGK